MPHPTSSPSPNPRNSSADDGRSGPAQDTQGGENTHGPLNKAKTKKWRDILLTKTLEGGSSALKSVQLFLP